VGSALGDLIIKGGALLGFDDARQESIMREAADLTNIISPLMGNNQQIEVVYKTNDNGNRIAEILDANTGLRANDEVFNAVNHALFSYDAGQNPLAGMGGQIKEFYQAHLARQAGDDFQLAGQHQDYFNNKFGLRMASQGLTREEAKNQIIDNLLNVNNEGLRSRLLQGLPPRPRYDLVLNPADLPEPNYFFRK